MEAALGTGLGVMIAVVIGGVIGWLASVVMKTNAQMGMVANVVVGIIGANLGSWLAAVVGFAPQTPLAGAITAVVGASALIAVLRALGLFK